MKTRIKFGTRKNGTRWYHAMDARPARQDEIRAINLVLRVMYGKVQQMQGEECSSKDQQD